MKVRNDFVTNSSSSSYVVLYKVNKCQELIDYMKEEYGKYGIRVLDRELEKGSDILANQYHEIKDRIEDLELEVDPEAYYLIATFITWTTEGDTEGDDAFLAEALPSQYVEVLYKEEPSY